MEGEKAANGAILHAKLFCPMLPDDFVPRPRLCEVLDSGLSAKLILVNAPAGSGKSTLVSAWLRRLNDSYPESVLRTSWLSMNESDNDLIRFWACLIAAIEQAYPDSCPATQELLSSKNQLSPLQLAEMLAMECQDLTGQLVLAIDDLYLIRDATVLQALAQWIDYLPPNVHLTLISRITPKIGIARLRSRKQLCEVGLGDLQFSVDEITAFLSVSLRREIPHEVVLIVQKCVEGWAAGMRLAAISLRNETDMSRAAHNLEHVGNRYINDYFADEVLNTQPPDIQRFLILTSSLPRLCAGLCAAVLQDLDAPACQFILKDLEQRNIFLIALDDHHGWYRYHHQFQALLQQSRTSLTNAPSIRDDMRRAAEWFTTHGFPDDALPIWRTLGDFDQAETLLEQILPGLQLAEDWHRLSSFLDLFPAVEIKRRPSLIIARAFAQRMLFRESDVSSLADAAEAVLDMRQETWPPNKVQVWRSNADVLRCLSDSGFSPQRLVALTTSALAVLPEEQVWVRVMATARLAYGLFGLQRIDEALNLLTHAAAILQPDHRLALVRLYYAIGEVHYLAGLMPELLRWSIVTGEVAHASAVWWVLPITEYGQGEAYYMANEIELARLHFERVLEWGPPTNLLAVLPAAYRAVKIYAVSGRKRDWNQLFEELRRSAVTSGSTYALSFINLVDAYARFLGGDADAAQQALLGIAPDVRRILSSDQTEIRILILAEMLVSIPSPNNLARANEMIAQALAASTEANHVRAQIQLLVLLARSLYAAGQKSKAHDALERAVTMGEPRGYIRCFIDDPDTVKMLKQLVRSGRCIREAGRLIDAIRPDAVITSFLHAAKQNASLTEPLTEREFDILACLSAEMTNKEIGSRLKISPLTVRNHTGHIYSKLGVATRRQAVARAKTLGLLDPTTT
jgi:LuxR family maltose regulon positive regulatory protein